MLAEADLGQPEDQPAVPADSGTLLSDGASGGDRVKVVPREEPKEEGW